MRSSSVFLPVGYSLIGATKRGLSKVPSNNPLLYLSVSVRHSLHAPPFRVGLPLGMFRIAFIRPIFSLLISFIIQANLKINAVFSVPPKALENQLFSTPQYGTNYKQNLKFWQQILDFSCFPGRIHEKITEILFSMPLP